MGFEQNFSYNDGEVSYNFRYAKTGYFVKKNKKLIDFIEADKPDLLVIDQYLRSHLTYWIDEV